MAFLDILLWVLLGTGFLIVGAIIGFVVFMIYDKIKFNKIKKNIPTDKQLLADAGKPEINKKEDDDDEQRKFNKFREFERLRRSEPANGANPQYPTELLKGIVSDGERSNLPPQPDTGVKRDTDRAQGNKPKPTKRIKVSW